MNSWPLADGFHSKKLAFEFRRQYVNDYKLYHHDRHTVGKVFSLRIQLRKVQRETFSDALPTLSWVKEVEGCESKEKADRSRPVEQLRRSFFRESTACLLAVICCIHSAPFRVTIAMQWATSRSRPMFVDRNHGHHILTIGFTAYWSVEEGCTKSVCMCQSVRVWGRPGRIYLHAPRGAWVFSSFVFLLCLFSALVRTAGCLRSPSPSSICACRGIARLVLLLLFSSYSYSVLLFFVLVSSWKDCACRGKLSSSNKLDCRIVLVTNLVGQPLAGVTFWRSGQACIYMQERVPAHAPLYLHVLGSPAIPNKPAVTLPAHPATPWQEVVQLVEFPPAKVLTSVGHWHCRPTPACTTLIAANK